MNRVAFILDSNSLPRLAEFFEITEKDNIRKELEVKKNLGSYLAQDGGLCYLNGFIEYDPWQRPDMGYRIDGGNKFISQHLINFIGREQDIEDILHNGGLSEWLVYCDLIVFEKSLFKCHYDDANKFGNSILLSKYINNGTNVLIFGGIISPYERTLESAYKGLVFWNNDKPDMQLPVQIKEAFQNKGLPLLTQKRKEAEAYLVCLDDKEEELDKLESFFFGHFKKTFFHGILYERDIELKEKIKELLTTWEKTRPFMVLLDVYLSEDCAEHVLDTLKDLRDEFPCLFFLVFSREKKEQEAVKSYADESGIEYLAKPAIAGESAFKEIFHRYLHKSESATNTYFTLQELEGKLNSKPEYYDTLTYARDGGFSRIIDIIKRVADTDTTVLITGSSGTGKELVARAIHNSSPCKAGPFIKVNCAAFPDTLIESELFGHEKGAFTGAQQRQPGKFEEANGGTIFLDEIGDLSPMAQPKLLGVLQEKQFHPLGSTRTVKVKVRLVAATDQDLVNKGEFREQLYYRLKVIQIKLPSLEERKEDIPVLIDKFLNEAEIILTQESKLLLMSYDWPGNVRQLENFCKNINSFFPKNSLVTVAQLMELYKIKELALEPTLVKFEPTLVEYLSMREQKRENTLAATSQAQIQVWENFMDARIAAINSCFAERQTVGKILEILSCTDKVNAALATDEDCQNLLNCICEYTANNKYGDWEELKKCFNTPDIDEIKKHLSKNSYEAKNQVRVFKKNILSKVKVLNKNWTKIGKKYPSTLQQIFLSHVFLGKAHNYDWR